MDEMDVCELHLHPVGQKNSLILQKITSEVLKW